MKKSLLMCALVSLNSPLFAAPWSYEGKSAPNHWGELTAEFG